MIINSQPFLALMDTHAKNVDKTIIKTPFDMYLFGGGFNGDDGVSREEVEEMILLALQSYYKKSETDAKYETITHSSATYETKTDHSADMTAINNQITGIKNDVADAQSAITSLDQETIAIKAKDTEQDTKLADHETRISNLESADYDDGLLPLTVVYDNQQRKLYGLNQGASESQANGAYTFSTQAADGSPYGDSSGIWRNKATNKVLKFNLNHYNNTGGTTTWMVTNNGSYYMAEFDVGVFDGTYQFSNITVVVTTNPTNKRVQFEFSEKPPLVSNMLFERIQ